MTRSPLNRLPDGVLGVGLGLAVLGPTTYAALALAAQSLSPVQYAPLTVLWAAASTLGPGVFGGLEQLTARQVALRAVDGDPDLAVLHRSWVAAGCLVLMLALVVAALALPLAGRAFTGQPSLTFALVLSLPALAAEHVVRGRLSGRGEFPRYGAVLALGGCVRLAGCAALAAVGSEQVLAYALVLAGAPLLTLLPFLRGGGGPDAGPPPGPGTAAQLGLLAAAALTSLALVNGPSLLLTTLAAPSEGALAGRLGAALLLARLPLFVFFALAASLVPQFARAAAASRRSLGRALVAALSGAGVLGGAGAAALALAGPQATRTLFGSAYVLPAADMLLLGAGTALFMVASVGAACLVALGRDRDNVVGWLTGVVVLAAVALALDGLVARVGLGLLLGSLASVLTQAALLAPQLRGLAGPPRSYR